MSFHFSPRPIPVGVCMLLSGLTFAVGSVGAQPTASKSASALYAPGTPPVIEARVKAVLTVDGKQFKDLNGNGRLDVYEDWRRDVDQRVNDLVARMTLEEKAGLMLIDTLNGACGGAASPTAFDYVNTQKMHRFIFRNVVDGVASCGPDRGFQAGSNLTPQQAAQFLNAVQAMTEATRLGIPALFKSNARNHYEKNPKAGINEAAGAFTQFPKEQGIAAAALGQEAMRPGSGMEVVKKLSQVMGEEWKSIGLRGMYGYMADLATEPRWYRVHETFTENADLNASIMKTLVENLQGGPLNVDSPVALTMKHFPGGGPQELGLDPHYSFGKNQVYPAGRFGDHLKPFKAAIDAGVSSIMPYYGVPIHVTYDGVTYDQTGFAFSKQIVTDLLRGELGFKGYVNSDTGIINDRAWGLEDKTVPQRVAAAINGGTDTLSGFHSVKTIIDLTRTMGADGKTPLLTEARVTEAARRLLKPLFQLGLFENPYVDDSKPAGIIGKHANRAVGVDVMRKSIVLLQNQSRGNSRVLPLQPRSRLYVMGMAQKDVEAYDYEVTDGEALVDGVRPSAAGHDYAVIRVEVRNAGSLLNSYRSKDPVTGANPAYLNPLTGKTWGSQDPCVMFPKVNANCVDDMGGNGLVFGGAVPWEVNNLSFTTMAASQSWSISPKLSDIQAVMKEIGPGNTVLSIYFRNPYVLDAESGLKDAGAIVAGFGVSNEALLDVLSAKALATDAPVKPEGKLPFALANKLQAVLDNEPDAPGYAPQDTLFPYNFGLTY